MDSNQTLVLVALIAATPGMLSLLMAWFNRNKIAELHVLMNSGLDKLLASTTTIGIAKGRALEKTQQEVLTTAHDAGRDEERARQGNGHAASAEIKAAHKAGREEERANPSS